MNYFALLSLIGSIIVFILANLIYSEDRKNPVNQSYALLCVANSYTAFTEFMMRQAESPGTALLWFRMESIWPINIALLFHFVLLYTKSKLAKYPATFFVLYITAAICCYLTLNFKLPIIKEYWGYTYRIGSIPETRAMITIPVIWAIIVDLTAFGVFTAHFKHKNKKWKAQACCIGLGLLLPFISSIATCILPSLLKIEFPGMVSASYVITAIIITYAIRKHKLFAINPATAAGNIISTMMDALILLGPDGKIIHTNHAAQELFEYDVSELEQASVSLLFATPEGMAGFQQEVGRKDSVSNYEAGMVTKNRNSLITSISASKIKDEEGNVGAIIMIVRNITEQKKAAEQLTKTQYGLAQQAGMAEIATGVIHDMGNTLNSIDISVEEIIHTLKESRVNGLLAANTMMAEHQADLADYLTNDAKGKLLPEYYSKATVAIKDEHGKIESEANQLLEKVKSIKEIINIQQDNARGGGFNENIGIFEIIDDTLKIQASSLAKYHIKIVKQYHGNEDIVVQVQRSKLVQVLLNILRNAIEAMKQNGPEERLITIEAGRSNELGVYIKITDNGEGIAEENLGKIFQYGFTTKEKGHGFGLHSSANAMMEMGGKISVESEGIGKGATFTLKLSMR